MTASPTIDERKSTQPQPTENHGCGDGYVAERGAKPPRMSSFLAAAILYAACLASTVILPAIGFSVLEQHSLDPKNTCLKVKKFLLSKDNPQVLVFGSSLMSSASVFADAEIKGRSWPSAPRPRVIYFYNYEKCDSLAAGLQKARGVDEPKCFNLSYPGLMVSEQYRILESAIEAGKRPELVVLSVAPRDFYSNDVSADVAQRPVYSLLSGSWSLTELTRKPTIDVELKRWLEISKDELRTYKEMWTDQILFTDSVLKDAFESPQVTWRRWLSGDLVPRLLDVFDAEEIGNELRDLDYYKFRYQPANQKMFDQESCYLEKFLNLARKHNAKVVIVDMPITNLNWSLIPRDMQTQYQSTLQRISATYGAKLVSPERSHFNVADFIDSVHLNARGGQKLFASIAPVVDTVFGARKK